MSKMTDSELKAILAAEIADSIGHIGGELSEQRRKALDLTQADLADQVGCSTVTVRKIEADERRPSKQISERLADVLAISQGIGRLSRVPIPGARLAGHHSSDHSEVFALQTGISATRDPLNCSRVAPTVEQGLAIKNGMLPDWGGDWLAVACGLGSDVCLPCT